MGEAKPRSKRLGRPPSPPGTARSHRVVTFVNDDDYALLQALSEQLDIPLSTTVYRLLSYRLREQAATESTPTHGKKR